MRIAAKAPHPADRTHLLGIRRPGRLALAVFRLPLHLYRRGWGRLLGRTFLCFEHIGRRTGETHEAVAMVLGYDPTANEAVICSAWGRKADWVRNLRAHPATRVESGRDSYVPEQRFLTEDEAVSVGVEFRRRHPWRLRLLATTLAWGDLRSEAALHDFVHTRPFVAFRPRSDDSA